VRLRSPHDREILWSGLPALGALAAGLDVLIAARLALLGARFAGRRWAVVGWG